MVVCSYSEFPCGQIYRHRRRHPWPGKLCRRTVTPIMEPAIGRGITYPSPPINVVAAGAAYKRVVRRRRRSASSAPIAAVQHIVACRRRRLRSSSPPRPQSLLAIRMLPVITSSYMEPRTFSISCPVAWRIGIAERIAVWHRRHGPNR